MGPPPEGELVQLQWTDGIIYKAKFIAAQISQIYQVSVEEYPQTSRQRVRLLLKLFGALESGAGSGHKGGICLLK